MHSMKIRRKITKADVAFFIKAVRAETTAIILIATLFFWYGEDLPFTECIKRGTFDMSLFLAILIGLFQTINIIQYNWRTIILDEEYPFYGSLVFIIINVFVFLSVMWLHGRGLFILLVPMGAWLIQIGISTFHKWTR